MAKEYFQKVQQLNPSFNPYKVSYGLAEIYYNEKNYQDALNEYKKAYKSTTQNIDLQQQTLIKIAKCYNKCNNAVYATRTYEEAINLNTKNYLTYAKLGAMQIKNKQINQGINNLQKAQSLQPNNFNLLLKLGEAYLFLDDEESTEQAIFYLKKALLLEENNYNALIGLGKAYEKKKEIDLAIQFTKLAIFESIQGIPNINSIFFLGILYLSNKDIINALRQFQNVLKFEPNHIGALIEYATALTINQEYQKAIQNFEKVLTIEPNNIIANLRLGKIYHQKIKDSDKASSFYQKVIKIEPENAQAHYQYGILLKEQNDFKKAIEEFKETLRINPRFSRAFKQIGNIYYKNNNQDASQKYYQRALECDPFDLEAKIGLANSLYLLENFEEAIKYYVEISNIDLNSDIEYNLGNCLFMKGEIDQSIQHYKNCLKLNPLKSECLYNLGNAYCIKQQFDMALNCFEEASRLDPKNPAFLYNLASCLYVQNNHKAAYEFFEKAINIKPDNIEWRNYVGDLYFQKGNLEKAKKHYLFVVNLKPDVAEYNFNVAKCFVKANKKEALRYIEIAIAIQENYQDAIELKQEILNDLQ